MTGVAEQHSPPAQPKPEDDVQLGTEPSADPGGTEEDDVLWDIYAPDGLDIEQDGYPRDHRFHREPVGVEGERICLPDRW